MELSPRVLRRLPPRLYSLRPCPTKSPTQPQQRDSLETAITVLARWDHRSRRPSREHRQQQ
jgi:hypothetical protein